MRKVLFYFVFHSIKSKELTRIRKSRGERSKGRVSLRPLPKTKPQKKLREVCV